MFRTLMDMKGSTPNPRCLRLTTKEDGQKEEAEDFDTKRKPPTLTSVIVRRQTSVIVRRHRLPSSSEVTSTSAICQVATRIVTDAACIATQWLTAKVDFRRQPRLAFDWCFTHDNLSLTNRQTCRRQSRIAADMRRPARRSRRLAGTRPTTETRSTRSVCRLQFLLTRQSSIGSKFCDPIWSAAHCRRPQSRRRRREVHEWPRPTRIWAMRTAMDHAEEQETTSDISNWHQVSFRLMGRRGRGDLSFDWFRLSCPYSLWHHRQTTFVKNNKRTFMK